MRHIATKFVVRALAFMIAGTVFISIMNIVDKSKRATEKIKDQMHVQEELINSILVTEFRNLNPKLDAALELLIHQTTKSKGTAELAGVTIVDGMTLPELKFGDFTTAGIYDDVDLVKLGCNTTATIFALDEKNDFVRIATNVPSKSDPNKRAVGTTLARDSQAYTDLMNGKKFIGLKPIQGKNYLTIYDPVFNSEKKVVGILYVGVEVSGLKQVFDFVNTKKILNTGFFVVMKGGRLLAAPNNPKTGEIYDMDWINDHINDPRWFYEEMKNDEIGATIIAFYEESQYDAAQSDAVLQNIILLILNIALIWFVLSYLVRRMIVHPLRETELAAQNIASGKNITLEIKGSIEFENLSESFNKIGDSINKMTQEVEDINQQCLAGNLSYRGDISKYEGGFRTVIEGFNSTLDNVVAPLQEASVKVIEIVGGKKSEQITHQEYINNPFVQAVNQLINNSNTQLEKFSEVATHIRSGNTSFRLKPEESPVGIRMYLNSINEIMDNYAVPLNMVMDYAKKLAQGVIPEKLENEMQGDFVELQDNFNDCTESITGLIHETNNFVELAKSGYLAKRIDTSKHKGEFKIIVNGFNEALKAIVTQVAVAAEYIDRIAKGDIPGLINEQWNGDFNEIRTNINLLIESFTILNDMIEATITHSKQGIFDYQNETIHLRGKYLELITGLNQVMNVVSEFNNSLPLAVFSADVNGNITYMNTATCNTTGLSKEEIMGKDAFNIFLLEQSDEEKNAFNIVRETKSSFQAVSACTPGIKEKIDVDFTITPLKENNEVIGLATFIADITEIQSNSRNNLEVNSYMENEIKNLTEVYSAVANGDFTKSYKISAPTEITQKSYDMLRMIDNSVYTIYRVIMNLSNEIKSLTEAASEGRLDLKANKEGINGDYQDLIDQLNDLIKVIKTPIREAGDVLSKMAEGDLTLRMTGDYCGEFNELKNNINHTGTNLEKLLIEITEMVASTNESSEQIKGYAHTLAASTQEQSSQADDVANATEDMARIVSENADSATHTAQMANDSAETARESSLVVNETINKMNDISNVVSLSAEKTVEATKEITEQISRIQHDTVAAVEGMQEGTKEVQAGIELTDKSGKALEQIMQSSEKVTNLVQEISAASEEQATATEQISKNIMSISQVSSESAHQVEDVLIHSENLVAQTEQLKEKVSKFKLSGSQKLLSQTVEE